MKHSTLLLAALAAASVCSAQVRFQPKRPALRPAAAVKGQKASHVRKAKAAASWQPRVETLYLYQDGQWVEGSKYVSTYDAQGRLALLEETDTEGYVLRTAYTYPDGNTEETTESSSEDGENFTYSSRTVKVYDPVVPTLVVSYKSYYWQENDYTDEWDIKEDLTDEGGQWMEASNSYYRTVTRDAAGNATGCSVFTPYDGNYDETIRFTSTFSAASGQATAYKHEELGYNDDYTAFEWHTQLVLENMAWHKTNGQLVGEYADFMSTGNYLASADVLEDAGGETVRSKVSIAYGATDDNWTETYDSGDGLYHSVATQAADEATGQVVYEYKYYEDADGDGKFADSELADYQKEVQTTDAQGNVTLYEAYALDEEGTGTEQVEGYKYDYTYDAAHGDAVKEHTEYDYNYDTQAYEPYMRVVTEEFVDVAAAIRTVSAEAASTALYTLGGARVPATSQPRGLYIMKQGNRTVKVVR